LSVEKKYLKKYALKLSLDSMKIHKCSFCGRQIPPGFGIMYVKNDGTVLRFCSRRCYISAIEFHRDPRRQAWVRKGVKKKKPIHTN